MLLYYSHTAVRSRLRLATCRLPALLLFEAITLPPLETSKRSHFSGWASQCRIGRAGPKFFFDLDICWLQKQNSGRNSHTEVQSWYTCRQRLIHTPCSTLPRLFLGGSCRRQLRQAHCTGAVPTARLWARPTITYHNIGHSYRSLLPSRQTTNTSVNWTGHMKAVDTLMASRLSSKPLLGIQTCRIRRYLASRHVESAVRAPRKRG